jgi:hypothetical protein
MDEIDCTAREGSELASQQVSESAEFDARLDKSIGGDIANERYWHELRGIRTRTTGYPALLH